MPRPTRRGGVLVAGAVGAAGWEKASAANSIASKQVGRYFIGVLIWLQFIEAGLDEVEWANHPSNPTPWLWHCSSLAKESRPRGAELIQRRYVPGKKDGRFRTLFSISFAECGFARARVKSRLAA